jgi:hypothetical protein
VLGIPDMARTGIRRSGRQTHPIKIGESANTGVILAHAGIVQYHPAQAPLAGMKGVVFTAVGS